MMEVTIGTDSFSVEIGGKTLEEIADAINSATTNIGVTASVIQEDSSNYYLTLTSDETGTDNEITLAFEDSLGGAIVDPLGMAQTQAAVDAEILVDNTYTITRSSNTITDVFEGVSLTLLDTSASAVELDVDINKNSITASVEAFVSAYNALQSTMSELGNGELSGDYTIRSLQSQVRSIINTVPSGLSGDYSYLTELGIELDKYGVMSLDSSTLSDAISTNLDSVSELFSDDDQGYAFRLNELLENVLDSNGLLDSKEDGINARIDDLQDAQENMQYRLEVIEARYQSQYAALDTLMSSLTTTSSYLDQQLSILANLIPGNDS
jgi:flagellar hook-associated protein 2